MTDDFDDPQLKQAVRRVWGNEQANPTASPMLRARVTQLLQKSSLAPAHPWITRWNWAIAAAILLFVGLSGWHFYDQSRRDLLPSYIADAMVKTHDGCCHKRSHFGVTGVDPNDFSAIGAALAARLNVPVIAIPLDNWQFAGGSRCAVRGHETAHMLYRDGTSTLSIFSIPGQDFPLNNDEYVATVGTHHIAGFRKDGGFYCVLVDDPDSAKADLQARQLRDRLRNSFTASAYAVTPNPSASQLALAMDLTD